MNKKWILALDASLGSCVLALGYIDLVKNSSTLVSSYQLSDGSNQTSTKLVPALTQVLDRAKISVGNLSMIACGCGPGGFTGTRVAVATAKGIAVGLNIPVVQLSSLAALAASGNSDGDLAAVADAGRGELYGATFTCNQSTGQIQQLTEPVCTTPKNFFTTTQVAHLTQIVSCNVDSSSLKNSSIPNYLSLTGITEQGLWVAATSAWHSRGSVDPTSLAVTYLRPSYAEMGLNQPKQKFKPSPFLPTNGS